MKPHFIKAELHDKGDRARYLADRLGVTEAAVYRVIHGKAASRRIAAEISRVTGLPLNKLWPGRYDRPIRKVA